MYTKILAQGTKFGSGTTGLDNPALEYYKRCISSRTTHYCSNRTVDIFSAVALHVTHTVRVNLY